MSKIDKFRKAAAGFSTAAFIAVLILQIILTFPATSRALSEEALTASSVSPATTDYVSIEADPPRLSSPGYVTIKIKLTNTHTEGAENLIGIQEPEIECEPGDVGILESGRTDEPVDPVDPTETPTQPPAGGAYTNVIVENSYGVTFATRDVQPGETATFTGSMMITEELIGRPLTFRLMWFDTGSSYQYSRELTVTVSRSNTTHLTISRTASTSHAAVGEIVTLTYTLVNTGTVRLTNIQVYDEKINGNTPVAPAFSLSSGERKEIVFNYTMREASVISKPKATFTTEGGSTVYTIECSKITIGLVNAQISKEVTVGSSTPEGVNFTIFLTNNGSQSLHGLSVQDETGHVLASGFSLAIGESKVLEHFVPNPSNVRNVYFTIIGTYADGKEFRDNTVTYPVYPYIDPDLLGMTFDAEIRKPLDAENKISLTFTVKNTGHVTYSDVVLTEKELGYNMYEIQTLYPEADAESFNIELTLDGPRELVFTLTATDPSGKVHTMEAYVNADYVNNSGVISDPNGESGTENGVSIKNFAIDDLIANKAAKLSSLWKTLQIVFIAALGIVLLLGLIEIMLFFKSRKKRKEEPEEMQ